MDFLNLVSHVHNLWPAQALKQRDCIDTCGNRETYKCLLCHMELYIFITYTLCMIHKKH